MKKILLCTVLTLYFVLPAQALTRNPYGIYYAYVYNNGSYNVKIIDVANKSVAQEAGISKDSIVKSLNNNRNLNFKNTRMYFDSSLLPIVVETNGTENTYNLKAKNLGTIQDNKKFQEKYDKYMQKGKYSKAITLLDKYIAKYPNDMEAMAKLVTTLLFNGQYGEAITNLDKMYKITKSPVVLGTMSSVYLSINDVDNAKKYAQQTLSLDKNEPTANATMFICSLEDSKFNEALNYANKLVEKDSKSYTSYFYRGLAEMNLKSYINAYKDLEKAFKLANDNKIKDVTPVVVAMVDLSDLMIKSTTANAKHFVETPSWFDICPGEYVYSNGKSPKWNLYWEKRRIAYLRSVYNSITNYSGEELYKSYASILKKEYRQNEDYKIEREHTWNQERREEIYKYTKDILTTALVGAYAIKTAPTHNYVHHSGTVNQNVNLGGSITRYNHYYFH